MDLLKRYGDSLVMAPKRLEVWYRLLLNNEYCGSIQNIAVCKG